MRGALGQVSAHGEDAWTDADALRTGGTRAQGHERWTSTENTTICMQRQGTRGKEWEAQDVGHGDGMERWGRRGVGPTTKRTQFVKGRGALDSPRNWLAASTRCMGTGQGDEGTSAVVKQHSPEDRNCFGCTASIARPGMGHVGNAQ